MQSTMTWIKKEGSPALPWLKIEHSEHCGKCKKHITFFMGDQAGGSTVEIHTDEEGLNRLRVALTAHPEEMKKQAQEKIDALQKQIEAMKLL